MANLSEADIAAIDPAAVGAGLETVTLPEPGAEGLPEPGAELEALDPEQAKIEATLAEIEKEAAGSHTPSEPAVEAPAAAVAAEAGAPAAAKSNGHAKPANGHAAAGAHGEVKAGEEPKKKFELKISFNGPKKIWQDIVFLFSGIISHDLPTRRMSWFFLLSLAGSFAVGGIAIHRYLAYKAAIRAFQNAAILAREKELNDRMAAEEALKGNTVVLGRFTIELKPEPGRKVSGVLGLAEVDISALCEDKDTAEFLEKNTTPARSQIFTVLTAVDRQDLLSHEGKKRLRAMLLRELNRLLQHGHITDIFFTQLMIN